MESSHRQVAVDKLRGLPLDHVVSREGVDAVSLRWIYVHLISEHARHGGHADILREQIDRVAGA